MAAVDILFILLFIKGIIDSEFNSNPIQDNSQDEEEIEKNISAGI